MYCYTANPMENLMKMPPDLSEKPIRRGKKEMMKEYKCFRRSKEREKRKKDEIEKAKARYDNMTEIQRMLLRCNLCLK